MEWGLTRAAAAGSTRSADQAKSTMGRSIHAVARGRATAHERPVRLDEIWTMRRAIRIGFLSGLAALLLWPVYTVVQRPVEPVFTAALALAAICGASILVMSAIDLLTVVRDRRVLPARIFDLAFGAMLAIPSGLALASLIG